MSLQPRLPCPSSIACHLQKRGDRDIGVRSVEAEAAGRAHDGPDGAQGGEYGHAAEHRRERDGHGRPDHVVKEAPHSLPHEQVGVEFAYGEGPGHQEEANSESK